MERSERVNEKRWPVVVPRTYPRGGNHDQGLCGSSFVLQSSFPSKSPTKFIAEPHDPGRPLQGLKYGRDDFSLLTTSLSPFTSNLNLLPLRKEKTEYSIQTFEDWIFRKDSTITG
jgi:hypothetical protein